MTMTLSSDSSLVVWWMVRQVVDSTGCYCWGQVYYPSIQWLNWLMVFFWCVMLRMILSCVARDLLSWTWGSWGGRPLQDKWCIRAVSHVASSQSGAPMSSFKFRQGLYKHYDHSWSNNQDVWASLHRQTKTMLLQPVPGLSQTTNTWLLTIHWYFYSDSQYDCSRLTILSSRFV